MPSQAVSGGCVRACVRACAGWVGGWGAHAACTGAGGLELLNYGYLAGSLGPKDFLAPLAGSHLCILPNSCPDTPVWAD